MLEPSLAVLLRAFEEELAKRSTLDAGFLSERLEQAMSYALMSPGKRLRPLLVLATSVAAREHASLSRALRLAMPAARAVEYVHTYSLIHDDLPAMDNDDYRRGKPTVHRRFDEALAILAGDALLADAFFYASNANFNSSKIVRELAHAAGSRGLVAGQSEDLRKDAAKNAADISVINAAKTARLFEACTVLGAYSVDASREVIGHARRLGHEFGLLFQLKDDLDDGDGIAAKLSRAQITKEFYERRSRLLDLAKQFPHHDIVTEIIYFTFATAV